MVIFTTDYHHTAEMVVVETLWQLHTLIWTMHNDHTSFNKVDSCYTTFGYL